MTTENTNMVLTDDMTEALKAIPGFEEAFAQFYKETVTKSIIKGSVIGALGGLAGLALGEFVYYLKEKKKLEDTKKRIEEIDVELEVDTEEEK